MKKAFNKAPRSRNNNAGERHTSFARAVATALVAAGLLAFQFPAVAQSSDPNLHTPGDLRYVKGRLLVQPRAGLSLQELDKKLRVHGGRRVGSIPKINVHIVQLPSQANEIAVLQQLSTDRHIKFVELDRQLAPSLTPNDPSYASGWHLPRIAAPEAWDYSVGSGITVAILDSGVDASHPDLAAAMVPGYDAYDNNTDTRDVYGHGTKVAGAAAMIGNNLTGGTGVSFSSRIMPIRITDTAGYGYLSSMAAGLVWAADHGARVANISFEDVCDSPTVLNAAQYMRNKNGVVVAAAGNTGTQQATVASDLITCVSATDSSDAVTSWSSYGNYVDLAAPGVGIYTTTMGGGYGSVSGTSFSAPITAGAYALMMAANPRLAPSQLDDALFSTAVDLGSAGYDAYYGNGRIDASAAVARVRTTTSTVDGTAPIVSITSPSDGLNVSGLIAVNADATDNIGVTRVELYAGGNLVGSDASAPYEFSWDTSGLADGQVSLQARAFDAAGNVGTSDVTVNVANNPEATPSPTPDTIAPSVVIGNPSSGATISGPVTITASASDNVQVASISLSINGQVVTKNSGSSLSYSWDPYGGKKGKGWLRKFSGTTSGTYSISATATDSSGNASSVAISVTVQ